ncbi:MAG: hypothetical protein IH802_10170 [Nitrospinae bacterium]|nr:hypothetical protein [Nitrospinota bacterium]
MHLNVVENQNPGPAVGFGNAGAILFSYGGDTPGPTIRMKGDETLFVKLRNLLGQDFGETFVGPFPHDAPSDSILAAATAKATALGNYREDFCLGEHTNGVHSIRVTNLHTHGLHVSPSRNPNGTHSDNVILRVLSQADFRRREQEGAENPVHNQLVEVDRLQKFTCRFLQSGNPLQLAQRDQYHRKHEGDGHQPDAGGKLEEAVIEVTEPGGKKHQPGNQVENRHPVISSI